MKIFVIALALVLTSCANLPQNPEEWMAREKNACLPTAIAFKQGLERQGIWAKVLRYEYRDRNNGKKGGHAIVAYMYPPGKNQLWTYDFWGSYRVRAYKSNPMSIALEAVFVRNQWNQEVTFAEYLD